MPWNLLVALGPLLTHKVSILLKRQFRVHSITPVAETKQIQAQVESQIHPQFPFFLPN